MFSPISKKDFYAYINPRDICVYAVTIKKCEFKTRYGKLIGYSMDNYDSDDETVTNYFIDSNIDLTEEVKNEN